jgi:hypothetical protein
LPHRIKADSVNIVEGADLQPIVTGNFVLVPRPEHCDPQRSYRVVFTAERANPGASR